MPLLRFFNRPFIQSNIHITRKLREEKDRREKDWVFKWLNSTAGTSRRGFGRRIEIKEKHK